MENYVRVAKGFDILTNSLAPYVAREFIIAYGPDRWWQDGVLNKLYEDQKRNLPETGDFDTLVDSLDIALCLLLADIQWNDVFRKKLSKDCRTWLNELRKKYPNIPVPYDCTH